MWVITYDDARVCNSHPSLGNLRTGCPIGKPVRSVSRKSPLTILTNQKRLTMELHITDPVGNVRWESGKFALANMKNTKGCCHEL